jgi:tetratricopeptide (TPR) repeat protein
VRYTGVDDGRAERARQRRLRAREESRRSSSVREAVPAAAKQEPPPAAPGVDPTPLIRKALKAYALGQYDAAESLYRQVLATHPDHLDALRGLGLVAAHRGSRDQARTAFERYLQRAPAAKDADAIRTRVEALQAPN